MRRVALTALAAALVWVALVAPEATALLTPLALFRIPIEGLALVAGVLALPPRFRRWLLPPVGVLLALLLLIRVLDWAFRSFFYRPYNLLSDWRYADSGFDLLRDATGPTMALLGAAASVVVVGGLLVAVPLALRRLAGIIDRHRTGAVRGVGVLAVAWVVLAAVGVAVAPGVPVASWSTAALASEQGAKAVADVRDQGVFAKEVAADRFQHAPGPELLQALRGKDVLVVFVESYGRVAVEESRLVDDTLESGTDKLRAQGLSSRSAWLTSSTFGGFSWLAHASLQTGLWVNTQQRHDQLMSTDRLTLSRAFASAGWRTVAVVPANRHDWPEGSSFYGYDTVYDARTLGYAGPGFGYAPMPDQYTLSALDRLELGRPDRPPVMAEVDLVTSHVPWAPLPRLVDWASIGDGSVYRSMAGKAPTQDTVWRTEEGVRAAYAQSIAYSLESVFSFLENTRDDNLVVLLLGDHQPITMVSGDDASHDVPVSLITRDRPVLDRISGWGWGDGLRPTPADPVWRMDQLRDRFLTAFGTGP
ncbi:MAG TPA: CDP-alcohol phosphatidyltransferase [Intrasporangium sp.]|uniref:CDP-alcohol phosphatidyltransferase n=1 Tax=Intrasporangium sp. TaxID=1925024 RepID=UPI002B489094|nr:CDP-alcohol phosphatidyltransferase [Intrasporangium sp.]HKX67357.1 CDP-alcohol phosphatidyltransferase [Intrasporangium sp.]